MDRCINCIHLVFCHDENHHECELFGSEIGNCGEYEPKGGPTIVEAMAGELLPQDSYEDDLPF